MSQFASRIIAGFLALLLLGLTAAPDASAESGRHLVLGRISAEPRKHLDRMGAMTDYLAARLADHGISGGEVVVVDTPDAMRELLRQGKVDLVSETAFAAFDLSVGGLARPLLREWKKGVAAYHSVIVVRKDSGLKSLDDLTGRKFAFEDAASTSGYLVPRIALEDAGHDLIELPSPRRETPEGTLGYSFAGGEINVIAWVNRGFADAGSISNLDWNDPEASPVQLRRDLMVIHETEPIIRSLMMVRGSLDVVLANAIAAILETMHESDDGRAVLKKYFKVARYDRLEGEASRGLESAREAWRQMSENNR